MPDFTGFPITYKTAVPADVGLDAGAWVIGTTQIQKDASGNLGIGVTPGLYTTANRTCLEVNGTTTTFIGLGTGGTARGYLAAASTNIELGAVGYFNIVTNGSERLRIDTSGNVGIGGTPAAKLDVATGNIKLTDSYSIVWGAVSTYFSGSSATNLITFTTNSAECLRLDSSGNAISKVPATPPTLAANSQMVFNLTSNTNLRVSVRGTDGVTRVANITLA